MGTAVTFNQKVLVLRRKSDIIGVRKSADMSALFLKQGTPRLAWKTRRGATSTVYRRSARALAMYTSVYVYVYSIP
jgi:hypothetical protein